MLDCIWRRKDRHTAKPSPISESSKLLQTDQKDEPDNLIRGPTSPPDTFIPSVHMSGEVSSFFNHAHHFRGGIVTGGQTVVQTMLDPGQQGWARLQSRIAVRGLPDSADQFYTVPCKEGTRKELVKSVMDWIQKPASREVVLCITGQAGTGKTTLTQTLIEKCREKECFLAGWFFRIDDDTRNSTANLVASLAHQICVDYPTLKPHITRAIEQNPDIFNESFETQARTLLIEPWYMIERVQDKTLKAQAVIIDAIDQCKETQTLATFATLLTQHTLAVPIKLVVISRPNIDIDIMFTSQGLLHLRGRQLKMHKFKASADIRHYLTTKLATIRKYSFGIPAVWPLDSDVDILVKASGDAFILPAMVTSYLSNPRRPTSHNLTVIARKLLPYINNPNAALDALFAHFIGESQRRYQARPLLVINRLRKCIQFKSHTLEETAAFFDLTVNDILRDFYELDPMVTFEMQHPVNRGPGSYLWVVHTAFYEFLDAPARSGVLHIPHHVANAEIAAQAISWASKATDEDVLRMFKTSVYPATKPDPPQPVIIGLQEWPQWLRQSIPPDGSPITNISDLSAQLHEFFTQGAWTKLGNALTNPELLTCQCTTDFFHKKFVSCTYENLSRFLQYMSHHLPTLDEDQQATWYSILSHMGNYVSQLSAVLARPDPHPSSCLACLKREREARKQRAKMPFDKIDIADDEKLSPSARLLLTLGR